MRIKTILTSGVLALAASLADRLDALAAQRRPWWRRLVALLADQFRLSRKQLP